MTSKLLAAICLLLGLLVSTDMTWSARWSRAACVNAVNHRLGVSATDRGLSTNRDAVRRCMRHGPSAID
jgi:hypothetical protein